VLGPDLSRFCGYAIVEDHARSKGIPFDDPFKFIGRSSIAMSQHKPNHAVRLKSGAI
jgi:hypothetical protein